MFVEVDLKSPADVYDPQGRFTSNRKIMEFGQLMKDILVNVSCKFEMYIFKIAQVINENVRIAFLYVLSIVYPMVLSSFLSFH